MLPIFGTKSRVLKDRKRKTTRDWVEEPSRRFGKHDQV